MKRKIQINELIFTKIKHRYSAVVLHSSNERGIDNHVIVDTEYPLQIMNAMKYKSFDAIRSNQYCISEKVSEDTGARKLHISELVSMLGYTKTDISRLVQAVKNKGFNIVLAGLGGSGSNFLHWAYELSQWVGKKEMFARIQIFEEDIYDIPNMLRVPFKPEYTKRINRKKASKLNMYPKRFQSLSRYTILNEDEFLTDPEEQINVNISRKRENTIIYGAPDIESRGILTDSDFHFIACTHRDNEWSLVENPSVDNDLMMETYGKIDLSVFFLNHLQMTIAFLYHLAQRDISLEPRGEVNIDSGGVLEDGKITFKAGNKKLMPISHNMGLVSNIDIEFNDEER